MWIKICLQGKRNVWNYITPHAGVWIEILEINSFTKTYGSRPTRACGLKLGYLLPRKHGMNITPHAGVWIEIWLMNLFDHLFLRHAPRGRVD